MIATGVDLAGFRHVIYAAQEFVLPRSNRLACSAHHQFRDALKRYCGDGQEFNHIEQPVDSSYIAKLYESD